MLRFSACIVGCLLFQGAPQGTPPRATSPSIDRTNYGTDLEGHPISTLAGPASSAGPGNIAVLVFLATDCPLSNRYLPEIERLHTAFATRGVSFWRVYPNTTETSASIHQHQRAFPTALPVLIDPAQHTTRLTGARITPEAAVLTLDSNPPRVLYLGRIDDRFVSIGVERPRALHHDLEAAITAALNHQPAAPHTTPAVGCGIVRQP